MQTTNNECNLDYIPLRLHWNNKPVIDKFEIGEKLYYRVNPDEVVQIPYKFLVKTLSDISVNRSGLNNKYSQKEDVLFSISEIENFEKYEGKEVVFFNLVKEELFPYFIESQDKSNQLEIQLLHDPVVCNYSHSIFRFILNGKIQTFDNFNIELGKSNRQMKTLRKKARLYLHNLIVAKTY
ncbi:MAG: hypothetical protein K0B10_00455 [Vicingaceae bacterium]|nr:hypothetical protein [Vicingaceae bacterium]